MVIRRLRALREIAYPMHVEPHNQSNERDQSVAGPNAEIHDSQFASMIVPDDVPSSGSYTVLPDSLSPAFIGYMENDPGLWHDDSADNLLSLAARPPSIDHDIMQNLSPGDIRTGSNISLLNPDQNLDIELWSFINDVDFPLSKDLILKEISQFFHAGYAPFPVVHCETIVSKINLGAYLSDHDFGTLILSVSVLNEAARLRRAPDRESTTLERMTDMTERFRTSETTSHFTDSPSMDTVVVSLFLFVAYSVLNKHNRAFCYLNEAIGLLDLVEEPDELVDQVRLQRLECVLFVTESASSAIYGPKRMRRIVRRPNNFTRSANNLLWYFTEAAFDSGDFGWSKSRIEDLDRQAVELMLLMTSIHLATGVNEVASVTVDDRLMASITRSLSANSEDTDDLPNCSMQTADVAITRQWKLAAHWWMVLCAGPFSMSSAESLSSTAQIIGMTTLQWAKTLDPGYLRCVGLGKVVALTQIIGNISAKLGTLGSCVNIINDLIRIVETTDYQRDFAPQLSITELFIGGVPRSMMWDGDLDRQYYSIKESASE
jgi:hypothetical protein